MRIQELRLVPVTLTLVTLQILVYYWLTYADGSTNTVALLNMGVCSMPLIREDEWWRLVSLVFLHVGLSHLVVSSVTLLYIGRYIEGFLGHWRIVTTYFVNAPFGNLTGAVSMPSTVSAGASTATFGLLGVPLMLGVCFRHNIIVRVLSRTLLLFVIINTVMDFFLSGVDLVGHAGSLSGGFFIVFIVGAFMSGTVDYLRRLLSGAVLAVSLVILTLELR